jgi:hypothetical protein
LNDGGRSGLWFCADLVLTVVDAEQEAEEEEEEEEEEAAAGGAEP